MRLITLTTSDQQDKRWEIFLPELPRVGETIILEGEDAKAVGLGELDALKVSAVLHKPGTHSVLLLCKVKRHRSEPAPEEPTP